MANKAVEILLRARDAASKVITRVKDKVSGLGRTNADAAVNTEKLTGSLGSVTRRLALFVSTAFGLSKIKQLFESVLGTGAKFETLKIQLEAVTGSAAAGEAAFAWIKDFTKNTPFQLDQVSAAFVKLKAFGLDPMDGTMQKLVDQSSKLGGGQETLNGIILAVGQAWAKQKLQGEEILQLVERGVPVWDLLSTALGKTTTELQSMSANGELGRDAIKALVDEIGKGSMGAAAAQMSTFSGIVSNLKDTFVEFLNDVADQGALTYFKDQLSQLADRMKSMAADGSLKLLARDIADAMIGLAGGVRIAVGTLVEFASRVRLAINELRQTPAITQFKDAVVGAFDSAKGAAAGLLTFFGELIASLTGTRAEFEQFGVSGGQVLTRMTQTATVFFRGFTAGIDTIRAAFFGLAGVSASVMSAMLDGASRLYSFMSKITFGEVSAGLKRAAEAASIASESIAVSAEVNFQRAKKAMVSVESSTQAVRDSMAALVTPIERVGRSSSSLDRVSKSADTASKSLDNAAASAGGLNDAAQQAAGSLDDMASALSAANEIEALNDLAFTFASEMEKGTISAQEYLALMGELEAKREDIIAGAERQAEAEALINETLKERLSLTQDTSDAEGELSDETERNADAQNQHIRRKHKLQGYSIQLTRQEADALKKATDDVNASLRDHVIRGIKAYRRYAKTIAGLRDRYLEASQRANQLAAGAENAATSHKAAEKDLRAYANTLEQAIAHGEKLDGQTLSRLQGALSAVKSKMQQIQQEAQSAKGELSGLESELAGLEGNQRKVQQLQYEQRQADLIAKKAEAEAQGNKDAVQAYERSLALLTKINQVKQKNIRESEKEARLNKQQVDQGGPQSASTLNTPARTVRMVFETPQGDQAEVITSEGDADKVVNMLQRNKGVTAR